MSVRSKQGNLSGRERHEKESYICDIDTHAIVILQKVLVKEGADDDLEVVLSISEANRSEGLPDLDVLIACRQVVLRVCVVKLPRF